MEDVGNALESTGVNFNKYNWEELQEFTNTLNKIYDLQKDNSLAGTIRDIPTIRASQAPQSVADVATQAFKKIVPTGDSPENAKKGLRILLEGLNKSTEVAL